MMMRITYVVDAAYNNDLRILKLEMAGGTDPDFEKFWQPFAQAVAVGNLPAVQNMTRFPLLFAGTPLPDSAFETAGISTRLTTIDTQLSEAACAFVREGFGISLVEPICAAESLGRGVVVRRFEPAIPYEYSLLYPRHRPRGRLTEAFVGSLRDALRENPLIDL